MPVGRPRSAHQTFRRATTILSRPIDPGPDEAPGGRKTQHPTIRSVAECVRTSLCLALGTDDTEGPELFGTIGDVAFDAEGNVLVLDAGDRSIRIFGADGASVGEHLGKHVHHLVDLRLGNHERGEQTDHSRPRRQCQHALGRQRLDVGPATLLQFDTDHKADLA